MIWIRKYMANEGTVPNTSEPTPNPATASNPPTPQPPNPQGSNVVQALQDHLPATRGLTDEQNERISEEALTKRVLEAAEKEKSKREIAAALRTQLKRAFAVDVNWTVSIMYDSIDFMQRLMNCGFEIVRLRGCDRVFVDVDRGTEDYARCELTLIGDEVYLVNPGKNAVLDHLPVNAVAVETQPAAAVNPVADPIPESVVTRRPLDEEVERRIQERLETARKEAEERERRERDERREQDRIREEIRREEKARADREREYAERERLDRQHREREAADRDRADRDRRERDRRESRRSEQRNDDRRDDRRTDDRRRGYSPITFERPSSGLVNDPTQRVNALDARPWSRGEPNRSQYYVNPRDGRVQLRTCYYCKKGGHVARDCWYNPENQTTSTAAPAPTEENWDNEPTTTKRKEITPPQKRPSYPTKKKSKKRKSEKKAKHSKKSKRSARKAEKSSSSSSSSSSSTCSSSSSSRSSSPDRGNAKAFAAKTN